MTRGAGSGGRLLRRARRVPTLLRTLRHLRATQAIAQIRHALVGVAPPCSAGDALPRLALTATATAYLPPPAHVKSLAPDRLELLATPFDWPQGEAWSRSPHGPLFAYHLHQHEYLRLPEVAPDRRAALIRDWIASHRAGIGWDPHPTGLRLLAWGKLLTSAGSLPDDAALQREMLRSFADQAETLSSHLEFRLQANHLLSNLVCVVFAGLLLETPAAAGWRARGTLLVDELARQIHPDGGHEERSPMYHAALLEGLLDLQNLLRTAPGRAPVGLEAALGRASARMVEALERLSHRDGRIALFADSGFDVAAEPAALRDYAARLGLVPARPVEDGSALLGDTGYVRLASRDWLLIASVAGPAPAHQPGHAHCDALAFELSIAGRRLVTDTGVFEYVPGARRVWSRTVASHSTVQIDDEEQAEIWAAHRVGGRPEVALDLFDARANVAEAHCRGWSRPRVVHRRRFRVSDREVELFDTVAGTVRRLRTRLPLAPDWQVELVPSVAAGREGVGAVARCRSSEDESLAVEIELPAGFDWRLESLPCYAGFGHERLRPVLIGEGQRCTAARTRFRRLDAP